jgi:glucosamine--fructose-6-phosphate aminotransferase (isomerizing)
MESLLWKEINEQPDVIRRLISAECGHIRRLGAELCRKPFRFVFLAARGTSDNAARYGQYLFGAINRLPVALAAPSLFTAYKAPPALESALVIGISQSGESPDIVEVLEEAKRQGAPTVAITNRQDSPLARAAGHLLMLGAGEERSVAATKTYTSQLAALAMLSLALADRLDEGTLAPVVPWMEAALKAEPQAQAAAGRIADSDRAVVIGRGYQYCTAYEIALKTKELAGVEAEPYSTADFQHGPKAMAEGGMPVILISIGSTFRGETASLADAIRTQGARIVFLGDDSTGIQKGDGSIPVSLGEPEWLTPIAAVIPGQLLAFHLARARGLDPDQPRHIRKVTRTH